MPARIQRRIRATVSSATALLVALAVLFAMVRGGTRFFYCPMTQLAFAESPCASPPDEDAEVAGAMDDVAASSVRAADCCEERWRAAAPTASTAILERPNVAAAGLATSVFAAGVSAEPAGAGDAISSAKVPFVVPHAVRAGPPPASARERRARLMVFHI